MRQLSREKAGGAATIAHVSPEKSSSGSTPSQGTSSAPFFSPSATVIDIFASSDGSRRKAGKSLSLKKKPKRKKITTTTVTESLHGSRLLSTVPATGEQQTLRILPTTSKMEVDSRTHQQATSPSTGSSFEIRADDSDGDLEDSEPSRPVSPEFLSRSQRSQRSSQRSNPSPSRICFQQVTTSVLNEDAQVEDEDSLGGLDESLLADPETTHPFELTRGGGAASCFEDEVPPQTPPTPASSGASPSQGSQRAVSLQSQPEADPGTQESVILVSSDEVCPEPRSSKRKARKEMVSGLGTVLEDEGAPPKSRRGDLSHDVGIANGPYRVSNEEGQTTSPLSRTMPKTDFVSHEDDDDGIDDHTLMNLEIPDTDSHPAPSHESSEVQTLEATLASLTGAIEDHRRKISALASEQQRVRAALERARGLSFGGQQKHDISSSLIQIDLPSVAPRIQQPLETPPVENRSSFPTPVAVTSAFAKTIELPVFTTPLPSRLAMDVRSAAISHSPESPRHTDHSVPDPMSQRDGFPHSQRMLNAFRSFFGLSQFRRNQVQLLLHNPIKGTLESCGDALLTDVRLAIA